MYSLKIMHLFFLLASGTLTQYGVTSGKLLLLLLLLLLLKNEQNHRDKLVKHLDL